MSIINFTVFCNTTKQTLLPWKITSVHPQSQTFKAFYESTKFPRTTLCQSYVGKSKDCLDLVDPSLIILEVASVFGSFVKLFLATGNNNYDVMNNG